MLGYRLVKVEADPVEVWAQMKDAANQLAASLSQTWQEICQQVEERCGQRPYMALLPGISIGRTRVCVRVEDSVYMWLPRDARQHWEFKASQVREAIEKMALITRDRLLQAAHEQLEK
jgi:phage pi2 protein 07